ncbi:MAG: porin family protein [Aestuariivirga sp.]|nr:porin family protein [Aestuariivirga sp.]
MKIISVLKSGLMTSAAIVAMSGFAQAADAIDTTYDWSGIYAGIVAGGGIYSQVTPGDTEDYWSVDRSAWGALVGGTLGVNFQYDRLVFGVEGDLSWTNFETDLDGTYREPEDYQAGGSWEALGTLRARAGLAFDRTMVFTTAGLAFADVDQTFCYQNGCGGDDAEYDLHHEGWKTGFTAGFGVEHAFSDNLTAKLEYFYVALPEDGESNDFIRRSDDAEAHFSSSANIVRMGLNYKYGGIAGLSATSVAIDTAYDWSGIYAGVVAGGGMYSQITPGYYTTDYFSMDRTGWGALVGGTLGVNFQRDNLVFGVEGDLSWTSLGVDQQPAGNDPDDYLTEGRWNGLGTLRARAGLAADRTLVYATAGLAFVNVDQSFCYDNGCGSNNGEYDLEHEGWKTGFAAGVGVEHAFSEHMTAKLEYLYVGLPEAGESSKYLDDNDYAELHFSSYANLVRLGLNYRFAGMTAFNDGADDAGYDWTGAYAGIVGGGGRYAQVSPGYYYGDSQQADRSALGALAGGTLGVNYQHDDLVVGLEGDLSWTSLGVDEQEAAESIDEHLTEGSWTGLGTLRARFGLAVDRTLVFATAGLAFANVDQSYCYEDGNCDSDDRDSEITHEGWQTGLAAGVGVEHAFTDHLTAKLEYLYIGLPSASESNDYIDENDYADVTFSSSANIARVGLNYKF